MERKRDAFAAMGSEGATSHVRRTPVPRMAAVSFARNAGWRLRTWSERLLGNKAIVGTDAFAGGGCNG